MITTAHIYTLSDPRSGEVRYVGRTTQPLTRYKNHIYTDRGDNHKWTWIQSLRSEKLKPVMDILEDVPVAESLEAEKFWIESLRFYGCRLTNSNIGGCGSLSIDAKNRAKISNRANGTYIKSQESVAKMLETRRMNGSQQGDRHPNSKLSNEQVIQIRSLAGTMKNTEIAKKFNIDPSVVGKIISGKAWVTVA